VEVKAMSKGPKTASKTTSGNRFISFLMVMPFVVTILAFLPPHLAPREPFRLGLFFDKIGFLFSAHAVCGVALVIIAILAIDSVAKAIGGGLKLGDSTELADFEGK
jgi:hypothetical protein